MKEVEIVSEGEVLVSTIRYLLMQKCIRFQISVPSGKGIDTNSIKVDVEEEFRSLAFEPEFEKNGPDVIAFSEEKCWVVECKGAGTGKPQTYRNNFDRALASVVSHYGDSPDNSPTWAQGATMVLALALPDSKLYLKELKRRVRKPLRQRLNLWVLLFDRVTREIRDIAPDQQSYSRPRQRGERGRGRRR